MKSIAFACLLLSAVAPADVKYSLIPNPALKSVNVRISLDSAGKHERFRIPAWCPGFYFILKYQDKISEISAVTASGTQLKVERKDEREWDVINPLEEPFTFKYSVFGDDGGLGFFGVSVRKDTAFVNGPSALMYIPDRLTEKCTLRIVNPSGWSIATSLEAEGDHFSASGYDELVDQPIQLGQFQRRKFLIGEIPFEVVLVSLNQQYAPDIDAEMRQLRLLSTPAIKMMGTTGFKKYLYIVHLDPGSFGGGLEHRASTVLNVSNNKPLSLGSLATHEYFHSWNVKQIRPLPLGPFDYTQPCRTGNLWFAEGVTDYYAIRHAYQSGVEGEQTLLESYASQIAELESSEVAKKRTLEDVCKGAWETGGFGDGDLSYYTKGSVAGLIFDLSIRDATNNEKSLDDVMRRLYRKHKLPNPGFAEDAIRVAISEVAGKDLSGIYDAITRSTRPVDYSVLNTIGLRLVRPNVSTAELGFRFVGDRVIDAEVGSAMRRGDRLLSVGGTAFAAGAFSEGKVGDTIPIKVQRQGTVVDVKCKILGIVSQGYRLERNPFADATATGRLEHYLRRDLQEPE